MRCFIHASFSNESTKRKRNKIKKQSFDLQLKMQKLLEFHKSKFYSVKLCIIDPENETTQNWIFLYLIKFFFKKKKEDVHRKSRWMAMFIIRKLENYNLIFGVCVYYFFLYEKENCNNNTRSIVECTSLWFHQQKVQWKQDSQSQTHQNTHLNRSLHLKCRK